MQFSSTLSDVFCRCSKYIGFVSCKMSGVTDNSLFSLDLLPSTLTAYFVDLPAQAKMWMLS